MVSPRRSGYYALAWYPIPYCPHPLLFSSPFRPPHYSKGSCWHSAARLITLNHCSSLTNTRYSTVIPDSGLFPRPGRVHQLSPLFPSTLDLTYNPTLFPSRRGESLRELQDRGDLFVEAWTGRMEGEGVKAVVIFAHAASVIALGRAVSARFPFASCYHNDGSSYQRLVHVIALHRERSSCRHFGLQCVMILDELRTMQC